MRQQGLSLLPAPPLPLLLQWLLQWLLQRQSLMC
jgi:hypothetical protein